MFIEDKHAFFKGGSRIMCTNCLYLDLFSIKLHKIGYRFDICIMSRTPKNNRICYTTLKLNEMSIFVTSFKLWIDADALPKILRDIIFRASDRYLLDVIFVANQPLGIAPSIRIKSLQVMSGADQADQEIVRQMEAHDIVVTQDIPLAAQVIEKGGVAIHPRGEIFTTANIKARLHLRDYMDVLRGSGVQTGGPKPINERDKREFASALDQTIQRQIRKTKV